MKNMNRRLYVSCLALCILGITWRLSVRHAPKHAEIKTTTPTSGIVSSLTQKNAGVGDVGLSDHSDGIANQILALLNSGDPKDQDKAYQLLKDWVRRDPHAAADFAQSAAVSKWHADMMVIVAQTWTDMNVGDAEAWASQLSNPTERNMVLGYVSFEEANSDPNRAVQVLDNGLLSDDRKTVIVQNLANQWANQDLQPLYNWISTLPAGQQRDDLYERVALAQSYGNPAQAAQIVANDIAPGPVQDNAALQVLRQWARQDMSAAVAWANQFPPGDLQNEAKQVLSGNLAGAYQPN
jgi:hypothetical protein